MEKDVVFIEEEKYQKIKKEIGKENDVYTLEEYIELSERLGEI